MLGLWFISIKVDHYIYFEQVRDHFVILLLYVDDIMLIRNNKEMIKGVKSQLSSQFEMKDLGAANFILGIEIKRDRMNIKLWLNQRKYVDMILQRFRMQDCKHVNTLIPVGFKLSQE